MNVSSQIEEVAIAFLGVATLAAGDLPISGLGERQETVEELHDRFKTWLGNIDVLPGGYKRLDECLHRASELRETVTELLQNLSDDLRDGRASFVASAWWEPSSRTFLICPSSRGYSSSDRYTCFGTRDHKQPGLRRR